VFHDSSPRFHLSHLNSVLPGYSLLTNGVPHTPTVQMPHPIIPFSRDYTLQTTITHREYCSQSLSSERLIVTCFNYGGSAHGPTFSQAGRFQLLACWLPSLSELIATAPPPHTPLSLVVSDSLPPNSTLKLHRLKNVTNFASFKLESLCYEERPPLWSSSQSFWLLIQRSRVRFPALPDFLSSSGSRARSTQPL
jgi:hypothetical protein